MLILDFPQSVQTSLFCMDFQKSLRKFFQLFAFFLSGRSTGVFKWSNTRFFLLWVAVVALKHWNAKVETLLSKHLWSILIVSDHFFEKWWPKTTRTDFCKVYELFNLVKSSDLGPLWTPIPDFENVATCIETWGGGCSGLSIWFIATTILWDLVGTNSSVLRRIVF